MQDGEKGLACQQSPEVPFYADCGDAEKYEGEPKKEACHIVEEGMHCLSEAVKDAGEGGVHVEEGAHESQNLQIAPGSFLMEDESTENRAREQEEAKAEKAEEQAVIDGAVNGSGDGALLMESLSFGDGGKQHHSDGAGEGGGEQDERERHACQNTVFTERGCSVQTVHAEPLGDGDRLDALQKILDDAAGGEGQRHHKKFREQGSEGKGFSRRRNLISRQGKAALFPKAMI